ncbi:MAG TPA: DUF697 domain-containing protein [Deltaproteobacteria bacterium]|nr:DUF697 domain-containing protein [Deltaproteobacteria bacterium]
MAGFFSVSSNPEVNTLVERCGYAAAALTILPIPGSEILGVMPLHVGMVVGIANHHGRELTEESATELVLQIGTTVGLSLVGSRLATTAAKFVLPGLGGIIAAPFMFASTLGLGAVADSFFQSNGGLSSEQMREVYRNASVGAKRAFRPEKMRETEAVKMASAATAEGKAKEDGEPSSDPTSSDPTSSDPTSSDPTARLRRAREMMEQGLIDEDEFAAVKSRILSEL